MMLLHHNSLAHCVWGPLAVLILSITVQSLTLVKGSLFSSRPLLIAHRGSPCSHPEETIASYQEALKQGADYLELDLVATHDNRLVLRHDATLDDSTDVINVAASGSIRQSVDTRQLEPGSSSTSGYFVTDFTLQELKALTAVQPFAFRTSEHNTEERIASISEIFVFFKSERQNGASAGLYMELKHPRYHADLGKDMPKLLMQEIQQAGVTPAEAKDLVVQCFDLDTLQQFSQYMKQAHYDIPLILLVDCKDGLPGTATMRKLKALSAEAGIGPHKSLLMATEGTSECGNAGQHVCAAGTSSSGKSNSHCIGRLRGGYMQLHPDTKSPQHAWVQEAHSLGLVVHAWTLRNEDRYMAIDFRGDSHLEMDALVSDTQGLGIDGLFVDCPISASRWLKGFLAASKTTSKSTSAWGSPFYKSPATVVAAQMRNNDGGEEVEVEPAAAISTYVMVAVLIAACGVYAWVHRQLDTSENGPYKVMKSPRVGEDEQAGLDSQRGSHHGSQQRASLGQTLEIE